MKKKLICIFRVDQAILKKMPMITSESNIDLIKDFTIIEAETFRIPPTYLSLSLKSR